MSYRRLDAIVAGELYVDMILGDFDFWPEAGQEAFARKFLREIGGGAAITACGLGRLGTAVAVFGVVGSDQRHWIFERMQQRGVDTSQIHTDPAEPTGVTVALTSPSERTFFSYHGANVRFIPALQEAAAGRRFQAVRHVHLAFAPPLDDAVELFSAIRGNGCSLSLDTGWHEDWLADPRSLDALKVIDIFFPNQSEASRMTGEDDPAKILARFRDAGVKQVALKLADRGAALLAGGEIFFVGPRPVHPVDTTGAGDSFDAGFLHEWLQGSPPLLCLETANVCGALSTEAYGGIESFPAPELLERELNRVT